MNTATRIFKERLAELSVEPSASPKEQRNGQGARGGSERTKKEQRNGRHKEPRARIEGICAAEVEPKPLRWLWPRYLLRDGFNLLAGDPGVGKSYLTAALATHVSLGSRWPDGSECPQGAVVMLSGEDCVDWIVTRLTLMGAALKCIHIVKAVAIDPDDPDPRLVRLSLTQGLHVDALKRYVTEHQALLCIVDPVDLYLEHTTQVKSGPAVRGVTTPLAELADATGCCALAVTHLNKASMQQALYRVKDSIDYIAAARSALCCGFDPDPDEEREGPKRRLVLPLKINVCEEPPGQGFTITDHGLEWDPQPVTVTKDEMLGGPATPGHSGPSKLELAQVLLPAILANGPQFTDYIYGITGAAGIGERTVDQAKKALAISSHRHSVPAGGVHWAWRLEQAGGGSHDG